MKRPHIAKQFYRSAFALGSVSEALSAIECLLNDKPPIGSLYNALWGSYVIAYCRPFTGGGDLGSISTKLIPAEMRDLHSAVVNVRNKIIGHTDPSERVANGDQINRLGVRVQNGCVAPIPAMLNPIPDELPKFRALADAVYDNIGEQLCKIMKEMPEIKNLSNGDYFFDYMADEEQQWKPN